MNRFFLSTTFILSTLACGGAIGQTWTPLKNQPTFGAYNPMLLFDGTVLLQGADTNQWFILTPDETGSYVNGSWTTLPTTGSYSPLYYASQVMPDGRVFIEGGEYNGASSGFTNQGVIFNPKTRTFTVLNPPNGWTAIGDMASVVLPNGNVMVSQPISSANALYNYQTNTWTSPYGSGSNDYNDEEGLTLLPNGNLFKVSCWQSNKAYLFNTKTATWSYAADTPYNIIDIPDAEMGPQVVMPDGNVMCFGGNGSNAIYHPTTNTWSSLANFTTEDGVQLECADAGAVLLPNGNILVQTGPGYTGSGAEFFEFNGTSYISEPGTPNAPYEPAFTGNFLMLPTGQALYTDQSQDIEIYTPTGSPNQAWAPTITTYPTKVKIGETYTLTGTQLTGISGCSAYGDDQQNETNYPLFRIKMSATGHVFYCPQSGLSTRAIATGTAIESANFTIPTSIELGSGTIQVVTNGIASNVEPISIGPAVGPSSVSVYQGTTGQGTVASVAALDGLTYSTYSVNASAGQVAAIQVGYVFPVSSVAGFQISTTSKAALGVTGYIYAYNYKTASWVLVTDFAYGTGFTTNTVTLTTNGSEFLGPNGAASFILRAVKPTHVGTTPFNLGLDVIYAVPLG